jgi:hypothetical protein
VNAYKQNWVQAWSIVVIFAVHFTFFPGVILMHRLSFNTNYSWFASTIITFNNFFDTIGRVTGKYIILKKKYFWIASLSR